MAVGDCRVTECWRCCPPYQTSKTVHVQAKHSTQRGRTHGAGCVRQWFRTAEPLGECCYENWNTYTQKRSTRINSIYMGHLEKFLFHLSFYLQATKINIFSVSQIYMLILPPFPLNASRRFHAIWSIMVKRYIFLSTDHSVFPLFLSFPRIYIP